MLKLVLTSLLFLFSCSNFSWNEVVIQGVKKDLTKQPKIKKQPPDPRLRFVGRYRFVGANIERGTGDLVLIKSCPRDSLFVQTNEFEGLALTFREKGQYFYDNIFFIDGQPPLNWIAEEDLRATRSENRITQSRKTIRMEGSRKVYLEYLTTLERVDDLLFYSSKVTIYRPHKLFGDELVPEYIGDLHCAYGFDSLTEEQKKAQVRDMGY
ncbi:MAG: hypothetical protein CME70_21170 [Halobacteriovorax sp.]|nr:hypothetical protein [Halobacteriovorax sp.]|tara:strand:- start:87487 stop:88116 length:630 start_codon:yes stop_codon:yes gene_type:complete